MMPMRLSMQPMGRAQSQPFGIRDEFAGTDGVALWSRAIAPLNTPGAAWAQSGAAIWQIYQNQARMASGVAHGHCKINTTKSDCIVSVDAKFFVGSGVSDPAGDVGLVLRLLDANNYWMVSANRTAGVFRIVKRESGVDVVKATVNVGFTTNFHAIVAVLSGSTISGTFNGGNAISISDATLNQTSGWHGMHARVGANNDILDNFQVVV